MTKGLAPIFFTTCGVVVAGVVGYAIVEPNFDVEKTPVITTETVPQVDSKLKAIKEPEVLETAKLETTEDVSKPKALKLEPSLENKGEAPVALAVKPTFGIVRVELDGSAVIAGQGPRNQIVELMDDGKKLAKTNITSTGEFVFVLDKPLEVGSHNLFLRVVPKNGDAVLSSSFAFIDVPKPNTIGDVTVLLAEVGKPSQILQKSKPASIAVQESKQDEPEITIVESQEEKANKVVSATAEASVSLAQPEEAIEPETQVAFVAEPKEAEVVIPAKPIVEAKLAPVLIDAADVENGKIFIAGTGEPLTSINIYLENKLLGTTQIAENGAFLFEGSKSLKAGRYDIRADMTKGGVAVLARAEVTLVHEPKVAEVVKEPELKPEPVEVEVPTQNQVASVEVEPAVNVEAVEESKPKVTAETSEPVELEPVKVESEKKEIQTGSAVIIRRGDSLWTVARRNYGSGIRYTTIFDANRDQVRNPHRIYPGQVLKIPEADRSLE